MDDRLSEDVPVHGSSQLGPSQRDTLIACIGATTASMVGIGQTGRLPIARHSLRASCMLDRSGRTRCVVLTIHDEQDKGSRWGCKYIVSHEKKVGDLDSDTVGGHLVFQSLRRHYCARGEDQL